MECKLKTLLEKIEWKNFENPSELTFFLIHIQFFITLILLQLMSPY